jgi:uncharacterized protein (TIGR00255 family)
MTGYGHAATSRFGPLEVEIRSVNNRFLKITTKTPENLRTIEPDIENVLKDRISRGSVICFVTQSSCAALENYTLNTALAEKYHREMTELSKRLKIAAPVSLDTVMQMPGVLVSSPAGPEAEIRKDLLDAVTRAADAMEKMRIVEGEKIAAVIHDRIAVIEGLLEKIVAAASKSVDAYRDRTLERVRALLSGTGVEIKEPDLIREVAVYADRSDINEEIERTRSHLSQLREALASKEPVGRKLEFIAQELLREANTMASKSATVELVRDILELKNEVDRIREQIQNIE